MKRVYINKNSYLIISDDSATENDVRLPASIIYLEVNGTLLLFYKKANDKLIDSIQFVDIVDEVGNAYSDIDTLVDIIESGSSNSVFDLATNDAGRDAWGRPKMIQDSSIFHGMFTYNVPIPTWEESLNGTILGAFSNATSVDGKLSVTAGGTANDITRLRTFRNPRYEPNRGYIYSTSVFLPTPTANGKRRFGYFTDESGAFFELDSVGLYAVVRTTINTVTSDDRYLIDTTGIDLSKGNLYDIQMQWRGVGNYKFFLGLNLVKEIKYAGTRQELTMFNPANPLAFECENVATDVTLFVGCVDISSEGGGDNGKTYGSFGVENLTGQISINGYNQPVIAVRSKLTTGGLINTRDTLALLATAYADQRSVFRIWATRDFTSITDNSDTWTDISDGHLEGIYASNGAATDMTFDTTKAKLIFTTRVDLDEAHSTSALFEGRASIYLTAGEMFIFTMHRETGGSENSGVTFEFAEEI